MANNSICGIGVAHQANIGGEYNCFGWFVYVCVCLWGGGTDIRTYGLLGKKRR